MAVIRRQSLVWKGGELTERMRAASALGINRTMEDCVVWSKDNHTWKNQTTVLEGGIGIAEFAREVPGGVEGVWGVQDVVYALIHELGGTIKHPGGTAFFFDENEGWAVFVRNSDPKAGDLPRTKAHDITIPARPYLRPSADIHYPQLADRIRAAFTELGGGDG